jgi:hypothetical protein
LFSLSFLDAATALKQHERDINFDFQLPSASVKQGVILLWICRDKSELENGNFNNAPKWQYPYAATLSSL